LETEEEKAEKLKKSDDHRQYTPSLGEEISSIEQEARMVLPGIQALFGFQLIAVFNQGFKASLSQTEQTIHLVALLLIALSIVLVLAPAAYHREANHQVSKHFVDMSSQFLAWAMGPLALGTCLDIYLVARVITESVSVSFAITLIVFIVFAWTWFIFPKVRASKIAKLPTQPLG
jgi:uncharacterized membrane protein